MVTDDVVMLLMMLLPACGKAVDNPVDNTTGGRGVEIPKPAPRLERRRGFVWEIA